MTKQIPLTKGKVAIIDDCDFELVSQYRWLVRGKYASITNPVEGKFLYMHRLITGAKPGQSVDHIDGNHLNNTRANLRICSHSENIRNSKKQKKNTSGYKGVSPHCGKWLVHIQNVHVGVFENLIEAARAYDEKAVELFGEFARLNFPERRQQRQAVA